jgi:hypothetical protein
LIFEGIIDIVDKTLPQPKDNIKDGKALAQPPEQCGYNPEEYSTDWDTLLDMASQSSLPSRIIWQFTSSTSRPQTNFPKQSVICMKRIHVPGTLPSRMTSGMLVMIQINLMHFSRYSSTAGKFVREIFNWEYCSTYIGELCPRRHEGIPAVF